MSTPERNSDLNESLREENSLNTYTKILKANILADIIPNSFGAINAR